MTRPRRISIARAWRDVPFDRLESRHDYLAHRLDQLTAADDDPLRAEYQAITAEIKRRSDPRAIARSIRTERFHADHYQPAEHRPRKWRGRKRQRRINRKRSH